MTKPRLFVVSELYYPEETSTGYFLTRIAEGLVDDFDVIAVCARPTYSARELDVEFRAEHNGVSIFRMRSTRFDKDLVLGRLLNLVTFSVAAFLFCVLRLARGDRVLVVTNPPTVPPLVGLAARLRGASATLLVHDVYPEVLVATGVISRNRLLARALGACATAMYRLFDQIVVLGRDMEALIRGRLGASTDNISIIPNWGDVDEIVPIDPQYNSFTETHNPHGATIVQFSGNIGRTHDPESLLEAAERLKDRSDIVFQFIGYGGKASLVRDPSSSQHGNVAYLPRQPRDMLNGMLSAADVVVIPFVPGMLGVSVPSRMYNVMAAATPILALADPQSELAQVVREENCGWALTCGDVDGLVATLLYLATPEGKQDAVNRGLNGRAAAVRRFSLPKILGQFRDVLHGPDSTPNAPTETEVAKAAPDGVRSWLSAQR